ASFYVVAFSTLILVIIAASFAAIIISEITRTSNDDLAQSAYDSALAGVEDAKLAFYNYQNCLAQGATKQAINNDGTLTCGEIIYIMEEQSDDCDMTARLLGRLRDGEAGTDEGIVIQESSDADNNMLQAYTCVKIETELEDYRSTLSSSNPSEIVKVRLSDKKASSIKTAVISWHSDSNNMKPSFNDFDNNKKRVVFKSLTSGLVAVPPTISVTLIQTGGQTFSLADFEETRGEQTDRATVFLVPTNSTTNAAGKTEKNYEGAYKTNLGGNYIEKKGLYKSNDKRAINVPYAVYCDIDSSDYACSVTLELPDPVGGERNDDTFMFVVSMPYGRSTDFAMQFCDVTGTVDRCKKGEVVTGGETQTVDHAVMMRGSQLSIDSTGRANDLFRRVETRLNPADAGLPYPLYAIQLLGGDDEDLLNKNLAVTCEWNFPNVAASDSRCNSL
ncbi:MAG: hypothetical protein Q4A70_01685, partial [Candidatus Saccharibacteria bacterium]|nr:hypothetical protein [Candidatus Saccharibacteria bacterium]